MDQPTTLIQKFKSTVHEMADSKKAMTTLGSMLASAFTVVGGFVFAHYGAKWGLDPALVADIPKYAAGLAVMIVGAAVNYVHGQAKVDAATVQADAARPLADREQEIKREVVAVVAPVIAAPPAPTPPGL